MSHLSNEQLASFKETGYLVLENVFSSEEVAAMQQEADYLLELIFNSSRANGRQSGRLDWRENSSGTQVVRKIQPINDMSLQFSQASQDDRLLGPMREIMGEEPILMEEKLNYKQPLPDPVFGLEIRQAQDDFPVHNDWAYYQAQNYPQSILSSALLLDDCTSENGPLHIWPGSQKEHLEHENVANGLQVKPGLIDFEGGIDMIAPAGSFMIFHVLVVHNSCPNTSGRPRRIMIYSHYPESAGMQYDVRNGPTRLHEAPWEREYMRMKERGEYEDVFKAPVYGD
jgi:ectoine hydroxylase-related dioxygenase (phytanoyl-CoA dioxygenase family)